MEMTRERQLRERIVSVCRHYYQKGFGAAADGNVSARLDEDRILITPTARPKGFLQPEDLVVTDLAGRPLSPGKPSSEVLIHLEVYRARPEIGGVVHAHPPVAVAYTVAGRPFPDRIMPEAVVVLGPVAVVPYATPGTADLPVSMRPFLAHDVMLLERHGSVTLGRDVEEAYARLETLEHTAKVAWAADTLGGARPLSEAQLIPLRVLRDQAAGPPVDEARLEALVMEAVRKALGR